ncbi:MAG TPA: BlaI/MecI/CopY family transcriptional regulator [Acidimicrobiales bacterium]|nr:BlaI/MecI/CopY family transcriptional regulator [Actinomycetes bacterium]HVN51859.1 BlaI/MecI/CopY family transcriptional regulator [Acidimicrobiales bacterium]
MARREVEPHNPMCSCDPCLCTDCQCRASRISALESRIMDLVWRSAGPDVTVREVTDQVPDYAYSTVGTVLDRLVRKGVLRCRLEGRVKHYQPVGGRGAHTAAMMYEALSADESPDAALQRFVGSLSREELDVIRRALPS